MADFSEVHRSSLIAAKQECRPGECWTIILRQPLEFLDRSVAPPTLAVQLATITITPEGKWTPATSSDHDTIEKWKKKHRDTAIEAFRLPDGLLR